MAFAINIGNPRAGWIDVDFRLDDQELRFSASSVLNDPVRELAELGLFIAHGHPWRARVLFWLEPEGYEVCASREPELVLRVSYSEAPCTRRRDPTVVLERTIDPMATAMEILRCLRAAQPMFAAANAADARSWHTFPYEQVLELEQALAQR